MSHLTEDEIYRIAEIASRMEPVEGEDRELAEHIRSCSSCYKRYCVMSAMMDAVDPEGGFVFLPEKVAAEPMKRPVACIGVICGRLKEAVVSMGKQLMYGRGGFAFQQMVAAPVRGGSNEGELLRMEDMEDEDTFMVYDPCEERLLLQLKNRGEGITAYVKLENESIINIPMEKKGNIYRGSATVPPGEFYVYIEE